MSRPEITREHVEAARQVARRLTRGRPWLRDECESAAVCSLLAARRTFDPGRFADFGRHAAARAAWAVRTALMRSAPAALRGGGPREISLDGPAFVTGRGREVTFAEAAPSGDLPVGWELEYQDEVEGHARRLPEAERPAFVGRFGRAAGADGPPPTPPCVKCGDPGGYAPPGRGRPVRVKGKCHRCHQAEYKRRARADERGVA
jgi:hypothetical protein